MAWYRTGTVTVTNGSTAITGSGTAWVGAVRAGWGFNAPDGRRYEVAAVNSNTSITLATAYLGTTGSAAGTVYSFEPSAGAMTAVNNSLQQIITDFTTILTGTGLGIFPDGTLATPAIRNTDDGDTGFWWSAANQLDMVIGGATRLRGTTSGIAITGALTGTAVTQTTTDTTAGRITKVGDFGLGGSAPIIGDCGVVDNTIAPGFYNYNTGNGSTGGPSGSTSGSLVHLRRTGGGGEAQIFVVELFSGGGIGSGEIWTRTRNTAGWTAWSRQFGQRNILGTVSQASGVPTGALIERGSNANGDYARFADGTQICTHSMAASSGAAATWTFPAAFAAVPAVTGAAQATVSAAFNLDAVPTTTAATFSVWSSANARRADTVRLMAVGRWF